MIGSVIEHLIRFQPKTLAVFLRTIQGITYPVSIDVKVLLDVHIRHRTYGVVVRMEPWPLPPVG